MRKGSFSALKREETEREAVHMSKEVFFESFPILSTQALPSWPTSRSGRTETDEKVLEALWPEHVEEAG